MCDEIRYVKIESVSTIRVSFFFKRSSDLFRRRFWVSWGSVVFGCYFILEVFYSDSAQRELPFAAKFMSIWPSLTIL